jgi:hypothetical protein
MGVLPRRRALCVQDMSLYKYQGYRFNSGSPPLGYQCHLLIIDISAYQTLCTPLWHKALEYSKL